MSETRDVFDDAAAERVNAFIDRYSTMSIIRATATVFGITMTEIMSDSRARRAATPRMVAMYLARKLTLRSLPQIGRTFGRHHATVLHASRKIPRRMEKSPSPAGKIETITHYLETEKAPQDWAIEHTGTEGAHVSNA
jgi:chromosomal replication initiator protein